MKGELYQITRKGKSMAILYVAIDLSIELSDARGAEG
jgi:hypothetical protein